MLIDEQDRNALQQRLSQVLGGPEASTLMSLIDDEDGRDQYATRADLEAVELRLTGRLAEHDEQFLQINGRLDGLDGRLDGLDGRLDGIDGRLDHLNQRFGERLDAQDRMIELRFTAQREVLGEQLTSMEHRMMSSFREELNHAIILQGRNSALTLVGTVLAFAGAVAALS